MFLCPEEEEEEGACPRARAGPSRPRAHIFKPTSFWCPDTWSPPGQSVSLGQPRSTDLVWLLHRSEDPGQQPGQPDPAYKQWCGDGNPEGANTDGKKQTAGCDVAAEAAKVDGRPGIQTAPHLRSQGAPETSRAPQSQTRKEILKQSTFPVKLGWAAEPVPPPLTLASQLFIPTSHAVNASTPHEQGVSYQ